MEVQPLIVRPSLFGAYELFRRILILWHHNSVLRLIQVQISATNQQQNDNHHTDRYPLHTTPFESSVLIFISA
jgi:hypothetical protein